MKQVQFKFAHGGYNTGEIASFHDEQAELLVEKGVAEEVTPPKAKTPKPPKEETDVRF